MILTKSVYTSEPQFLNYAMARIIPALQVVVRIKCIIYVKHTGTELVILLISFINKKISKKSQVTVLEENFRNHVFPLHLATAMG